MATGKTAIAGEGGEGLACGAADPGAGGVCMTILSAWAKRMIPAVIETAGEDTCQFPRTSGASNATTSAIAVAIAVDRHATVR